MPFSERVKLLAKIKAAFRCCVCHRAFVEVHHLLPEASGGPNELSNAAPLCASCHDLFGGNPEKRKTLRQMRDHWWELMAERQKNLTDLSMDELPYEIAEDSSSERGLRSGKIAIYHLVLKEEDFETSAQIIVKLIRQAQTEWPNTRRQLYLDIDGHRNSEGGI